MKKQISIIVPIYNTGERLKKCLDSLTEQTMKEITIICVNDGSTDNSLDILEQYARKFSDIKIINQQNKGRSSARNAGLSIVETPFIMFCDSDDFFMPNMCKKMLDSIIQNNTDIAICGVNMIYEAYDEMESSDNNYYRIKFSGRHFINDRIIIKTDASVCNKIFRTDLIKKYDINFPDKINNEDYYFYNAYMSIAQTAYFLPQKLYNYIRHNNGSIMADNFNKNIYSPDHLDISKKLFYFYKKNKFLKQHTDLFWHQFSESFWFSYLHSSRRYHKKIQKMGNVFIDENYSKYIPNDKKIKNEIFLIRHNNISQKIIRHTKNAVKKSYKKINIAYKQQEVINKKIEKLEQQTYELVDIIDRLQKQ